MSFITDFKDEAVQSITIQAVSSTGLYGPTYASASTYACHAKPIIETIKRDDGKDAVSSLRLYLDGHPTILNTAKVTYAGATPPILKIQRIFDEKGAAYCTIIYT